MNNTNRLLTVLILLVAMIGLGIVYAFAQSEGTNTINACINNDSGRIRIVANGSDCHSNEYPLDWQIQGEPGPDGPPGEGISNIEVVWASSTERTIYQENKAEVYCPEGKFAIAGGGIALTESSAWMVESRPIGGDIPVPIFSPDGDHYLPNGSTNVLPTGWAVGFNNGSAGATVYVICANMVP